MLKTKNIYSHLTLHRCNLFNINQLGLFSNACVRCLRSLLGELRRKVAKVDRPLERFPWLPHLDAKAACRNFRDFNKFPQAIVIVITTHTHTIYNQLKIALY